MNASLKRKPIVIIVTGTMNAGGTETLIMEMLRQSTGRVNYIMLIHYTNKISEGVFDREIRDLGIPIHYIPSPGSIGLRRYTSMFKSFISEIGHADIVHSHLNGIGGLVAIAAKRAGVKHRICHCHADIRFTGSTCNRFKQEISLFAMKGLIELFATQYWACSIVAWKRLFMPWHKRVVIDNMIDAKKYIATLERRLLAKKRWGFDKEVVIGAVGRVAPIKNYETILHALVGNNCHFVCFGRFNGNDEYCRSLVKLSESLGVAQRVHWMGNSDNISDDIHAIDLFVMPSITEGFGIAALEAQAASLKCLLSNGVPPIIDIGLGLVSFLDPTKPDTWQDAFNKASKHKIIPEDMILKKFRQCKFDSAVGVKEIEDKYLNL